MVIYNKKKVVSNCLIDAQGNNLFISLTKFNGDVIARSSAGLVDLKGPKKKTSYAAELIGRQIALKALKYRINYIYVIIKGNLTKSVKSALIGLSSQGIQIINLKVLSIIPHHIVRVKKIKRR